MLYRSGRTFLGRPLIRCTIEASRHGRRVDHDQVQRHHNGQWQEYTNMSSSRRKKHQNNGTSLVLTQTQTFDGFKSDEILMTTLSRNEVSRVIRAMSNPRNIRALSRVLVRAGYDRRIKENAAKRVVGVRVSELYRRRKAVILNWSRKFNQTELERLPNNAYTRRINSIPNPPHTRTNLIKTVIARYLLSYNARHWPNAAQAIQTFHNVAGHQGNTRIQNARLVNFVMGLPTNRLRQFNINLPFYS
jgi:hypothetical protein